MKSKLSIGSLLSIILRDRHFIPPIILYSAVISLLSLAIPISVQTLVNSISFSALGQPILILTLILLLVLLISAFFHSLLAHLMDIFHRRLFSRVASEVTTRLHLASPDHYRNRSGTELVNRFFDIFTVQKSISILLTDGFSICLQILVGLSLIATYNIVFVPLSGFIFISILLIVVLLSQRGCRTSIEESKAKYNVVNWLEESTRIYTNDHRNIPKKYILGKTEDLISKYVQKRSAHFKILFSQMILFWTLYALSSAALLGLGGWLVMAGKLSLGQLVAAEIVVSGILYNLGKSGKYLELYYDLIAALDKLSEFYELPLRNRARSTKSLGGHIQKIEFSNVRFNKDKFSLRMSCSMQKGSKIAVISKRGSSRDIFIDLLLGILKPSAGDVFVDDTSLEHVDIEEYWSQIYIFRSPITFEGTIHENLLSDYFNRSDSEVKNILELLELDDVIDALPQKFETRLSASGYPLSPSQAIRLDLARGLLSKPSVVVLTESVNHLGTARQEKLFQYLMQNHPWILVYFCGNMENNAAFDQTLTLDHGGLHD